MSPETPGLLVEQAGWNSQRHLSGFGSYSDEPHSRTLWKSMAGCGAGTGWWAAAGREQHQAAAGAHQDGAGEGSAGRLLQISCIWMVMNTIKILFSVSITTNSFSVPTSACHVVGVDWWDGSEAGLSKTSGWTANENRQSYDSQTELHSKQVNLKTLGFKSILLHQKIKLMIFFSVT